MTKFRGKVYFATSVHPHTFSPFKPINKRCTGYHRLKQWEGSITSFGSLCVCVCLNNHPCELDLLGERCLWAAVDVVHGAGAASDVKQASCGITSRSDWPHLVSSPYDAQKPFLPSLELSSSERSLSLQAPRDCLHAVQPSLVLIGCRWEPTNPPVGIHLLPPLYLWNQHTRRLIRMSRTVCEAIADEIL